MAVKIKTIKNDFPKMEKAWTTLDGRKVSAGVLKGIHAWLAGIHEYGCNITVTDKMRKYLASQGLYLKKSTTVIHIPERSFLRSGFDEHHDEVLKKTERMISTGLLDADELCKGVGLLLSGRIKDYAKQLSMPAKHPFTLKQNGGKEKPLRDGGDMIGGISYKVE